MGAEHLDLDSERITNPFRPIFRFLALGVAPRGQVTQKFYQNSGEYPFQDTITNIHSNLSKKLRKTGYPVSKMGERGGVESVISHSYKANAINYVTGVYSYSKHFVCLLIYKSTKYVYLSVC